MVAETLKVRVEAETQDAETKLGRVSGKTEQASTSSNKLAGSMGKAKIAIAAAGVAAAAAGAAYVIHLVRSGMEAADEQAKLARQLGVTNEELAVMQRAANLAGISSRELASNMERLNRRLGDAAEDGGQAADALDRIGLSVEDIEGLSPDEQMETLGEALSGVESQARRASIASDLFGRSGQRMMLLLDDAAGTFDRARREVEVFNLALDESDTDAIEALNDNMSTLGAISTGVANTLAASLAPALTSITNSMIDFAEALFTGEQRLRSMRESSDMLAESQRAAAEAAAEREEEDLQAEINKLLREEVRLSQEIGKIRERKAETSGFDLGIISDLVSATWDLVDVDVRTERQLEAVIENREIILEQVLDQRRAMEEMLGSIREGTEATEEEVDAKDDVTKANNRVSESIRRIEERREAGLITELEALRQERAARMQFIRDYQEMGIAIGELANVESIKDLDRQINELTESSEEATRKLTDAQREAGDAFTRGAGGVEDMAEAMEGLNREREQQERADQRMRDRFDTMTEGNIAAIHRQRDEFIAAGVDQVDAARWAATQIAQEYMSMAQQVGSAVRGLAQTIISSQNEATQNKIRKLQDELSAIEERHDREIEFAELAGASESELADLRKRQLDEQQKAEEEADAKEAELKEQQFRREQLLLIGEATMNTASAVVAALPNLPLSAFVGALGLAQIGKIASQSPPAFERGGSFVTSGPQTIQVGDGQSPRERVTVEPLSGPYARGGGDTYNIRVSGVIGDREDVARAINEALRRSRERGRARES